jgi:hypothetical protein
MTHPFVDIHQKKRVAPKVAAEIARQCKRAFRANMGNVSSPKFILSSVFLSGIDW